MLHCRPAERAIVAALALGLMDAREFTGRLHPADFTDPAAGECFVAALEGPLPARAAQVLPELLRQRGRLRGDGYPVRELVGWLPLLPAPAHPEAWATLIVAGSMGRVIEACGVRLQQVAVGCDPQYPEVGRVLAMTAAQRAALHGSLRRWQALPDAWRASVAELSMVVPSLGMTDEPASPAAEREVLAGVLAAPVILNEVPWLREEDFTDPRCAEQFGLASRMWEQGRCVDAVTVSVMSASDPTDSRLGALAGGSAEVFPAAVPFLARRLVAQAVVREALGVGRDLVAMAGAPASVGGIGAVQLRAALDRLDGLRPYAERWEQARPRPVARSFAPAMERAPVRVAEPRAAAALDRRSG